MELGKHCDKAMVDTYQQKRNHLESSTDNAFSASCLKEKLTELHIDLNFIYPLKY
jgi:hypothetical protein